MSQARDNTVLFLCTGNYYRSRFAEILFNAVAAKEGLGWRADSRNGSRPGLRGSSSGMFMTSTVPRRRKPCRKSNRKFSGSLPG